MLIETKKQKTYNKKDKYMKIQVQNKQYEINIERAIELGICKKIRQEITDFRVGDVFETPGGTRVLTIQTLHWADAYNIVGFCGVLPYSDFNKPLTYEEMIKHLNEDEYEFVDNINEQINELIANAKAI